MNTNLLDRLICPREHVGQIRQADLLCRFQVDEEPELLRLLYWEIGGLGPLEDFVYEDSGAAELIAILVERDMPFCETQQFLRTP